MWGSNDQATRMWAPTGSSGRSAKAECGKVPGEKLAILDSACRQSPRRLPALLLWHFLPRRNSNSFSENYLRRLKGSAPPSRYLK